MAYNTATAIGLHVYLQILLLVQQQQPVEAAAVVSL